MKNRISTRELPWDQAGRPGYVCRVLELAQLPLTELGVHLEELTPGNAGCPLHYHLCEEEQFYVLHGALTVRELAPDAEAVREYTVRSGDLVVWPPGTRIAHQFVNRGAAPALFVAMSDRRRLEVCVYPDSGKVMMSGVGVGLFPAPDDPDTTLAASHARALARPVEVLPDDQRPSHVVSADQVPERALAGGFGRPLSRAAGARSVFVNLDRLPPGSQSSELHAHLADEELVYVLSGHPTLRQVQGRRNDQKLPVFDAPEERARLNPGDVVHWAPDDLVAHHLLNETDDDVVLFVFGTDFPHDVTLFPESGQVRSSLLDRRARFTRTDYWAGEERS